MSYILFLQGECERNLSYTPLPLGEEGGARRRVRGSSPNTALDFFTASKPWVSEASLTPVPSLARAGEGCRRRGEGRPTQGSRPGLLSFAPDGAPKRVAG